MTFWAYMLHCYGGKFYVGHTDDLERRVAQHQSGAFPGFTKDHGRIELVWSENFQTRDEAKTCERKLKGWSRAKKLALIRGDWSEISRLSKGKSRPSTSSGQAEIGDSDHVFSPTPSGLSLSKACSSPSQPEQEPPHA